MASWNPWKLTQKGQQFQAKVNAGLVDAVTYTKFALGSGIASGSLESLTELVQKEMDLPMKSVAPQNNAVEFNTLILNNDVEADFYCREMGLYVTDPDDGEILYAVSTDNYPDLMPAAGGATVVAYNFTLILIFSNTGNVVSYVRMEALATMQDIENHNTNANAHSNLALTVNDGKTPTLDTDTLVNLISALANRRKADAGITSWKDDPPISLATLATLVGNLSSGSDVRWDGNKFTNTKLGVSGLMAQNGYINMGPNYGGLIIQWGLIYLSYDEQEITLPITSNGIFIILGLDNDYGCDRFGTQASAGNKFKVWSRGEQNSFAQTNFQWVAICRQ